MNSQKINSIIIITFLLTSFCLTQVAWAGNTTALQEVTSGIQKTSDQAGVTPAPGSGDLSAMAGRAINYFFGIVAIVFLTVIIIGGYLWMASGGNEENMQKAKTFILNGIFGLMVIFIAYGLVALILVALKMATFEAK